MWNIREVKHYSWLLSLYCGYCTSATRCLGHGTVGQTQIKFRSLVDGGGGKIKGVSTWHFNVGTRFWIEWVYPSLIVGDWNLRTLERRWNDPGRVWGRAVVRGMCVFTIGQKESAWLGSEWRRSRRRHTVVCTFLCEVQCEVERQQN